MKKLLVLITVIACAMMAQAATLSWNVDTRLEDSSINGYIWAPNTYANEGTDLYLIYNGVSGTAFAGVQYDLGAGEFQTSAGVAISFADTYTTTAADFSNGSQALQNITGVDLTTYGTPADWNDMDYSFTILAVSDADGIILDDDATFYGVYTADASGFSELTGAAGHAYVATAILDAGGTAMNVVPEPATIGLFGLGALSAWIVRRNKLKAREEV